jgi:hypothetical protein
LTGEHIADGGKVDRWNGVVMLIEMKGKGLERIWFLNINIYYLDCETEDSIKVTEEQKGTERSDYCNRKKFFGRLELHTATKIQVAVFRVLTPCSDKVR